MPYSASAGTTSLSLQFSGKEWHSRKMQCRTGFTCCQAITKTGSSRKRAAASSAITRPSQNAEAVGHKVARKRKVVLLVHDRSGAIERRMRPSRGWFSRLFSSWASLEGPARYVPAEAVKL